MVERARTPDGIMPPRRTGGEQVSWSRLLWCAPLTVIAALLVNLAISRIAVAIDPGLAAMGQLGRPLVVLTTVGAILAVLAFALIGAVAPRPITTYRVVAVVALLVSLVPDVLLGLGGDARRAGSSMVAPFIRLGGWIPGGQAGPRPRAGGSPTDSLPALPPGQMLLLMLLHVATAVVCVVLLTTLAREPAAARPNATSDRRV